MTSTIIPRSWQCPNVYIDELLPMLTDPEWRVLSYMTRQIFGWEDGRLYNRAQIGLAAMVDGCGLSVAGARSALAGLQQFGIVVQVEESRGPVAATWSLQVDADLIDVAGLQARREEKRAGNRARTAAAQTVLSDRTQSDLSDRTDLYIDQNQSSKPDLKPDDPDRQTDRDLQPSAGVCLSDTEKPNAAARREIIQAFQQIGVVVPSAHDSKLDAWIVAYPMPAILWAIREVKARRAARERITSAFAYASKILENKAAEGWPAEVLEEMRRGGYAMPADVHDPTAGEFPEAAQVVADDPADDTAQAGGWSPADVQPDPGSELDQAWAAALAMMAEQQISPRYVGDLSSCRLVDLNGRATVRAHDDRGVEAVQRLGRQIEVFLGVSGVDLAPAA